MPVGRALEESYRMAHYFIVPGLERKAREELGNFFAGRRLGRKTSPGRVGSSGLRRSGRPSRRVVGWRAELRDASI